MKIKKTGVLLAGGEPRENLVLNSLCNSTTGWGNVSHFEVTTKDGYDCFHITGVLETVRNTAPTFSTTNAKNYIPSANQIVALSCDVLFENVVYGTKNTYIDFYPSGATIDGAWRAPTRISECEYMVDYNGARLYDKDKLNGKGWTRVWVVYQYGDYTWPAIMPYFIARDITGDVYFKSIKYEVLSSTSDKPTPWTPNSNDAIFTASKQGFIEDVSDVARVQKYGGMTATGFYEL